MFELSAGAAFQAERERTVAANLRRRQLLDAAAAATTQPAEARPTKAPEARRTTAPLTARAGR